jgi:hypothetical protein
MSSLREAFRSGLGPPSSPSNAPAATRAQGVFEVGVGWVRDVLCPEVDRANSELLPEGVALRLNVNLDSRSTNHAHADLWFCELGDGHRRNGTRYSLNVIDRSVWLYKGAAPGRTLGEIEGCGSEVIQALLREGAQEFGAQLR